MAGYVHQVHEVHHGSRLDPAVVEETTHTEVHADAQTLAARFIWYIDGILVSLLAIRFLLSLFGANLSNAFASFIYGITYPFAAPFFGLFNYNLRYGVSQFEVSTLVAIVVYTLIAFAIARLITLNRPDVDA